MSNDEMSQVESPLNIEKMDKSKNPRLEFKVQTTQGFKIISAEMAMAIYLKKLIEIYKKHTNHEVKILKFFVPLNKFNKAQKKCIKRIGNILERRLKYCKFAFQIKFY